MWIEAHPELENHPKLLRFCQLLKVDKTQGIGLLFRFWFWCTAYAEDGDLRKHGISTINSVLGLDIKDNSLFLAGFVEKRPFLRVHDWWDYYGRYLKLKYRNNSKKLMQIEYLCTVAPKRRSSDAKDTLKQTYGRTDVPDVQDMINNGRTDVPGNEKEITAPAPQPRPKGASDRAKGHGKNCVCESCFQKVWPRTTAHV